MKVHPQTRSSWGICLLCLVGWAVAQNPIPAPITFEPSGYWDGNDGPWSSFGLRLGPTNNTQHVRVFPSFFFSNIFVVEPSGCPSTNSTNSTSNLTQADCAAARGAMFSYASSADWAPMGDFTWSQGSPQLDLQGIFGQETVGLTWDDTEPIISSQTVAAMAKYDFWVGSFGISPSPFNVYSYSEPMPSFFQSMNSTGRIAGNSWSYTAGAFHRNFTASLIFGGYDVSRFDSDTSVKIPVVQNSDKAFTALTVQIQRIRISGVDAGVQNISSAKFEAAIEPAFSALFLSDAICGGFERAFNLSWDPASELYFIGDAAHEALMALRPNITFTICDPEETNCHEIAFPYAAFALSASYPLIKNPNGTIASDNMSTSYEPRRYFPIKPSKDSSSTLGRAFLQETHIFADFDRHYFNISQTMFDPTAESRVITVQAPAEESSGLSGAAIAGIVSAVLTAVSTVGYLAFAKAKKRWPFRAASTTAASAVEGEEPASFKPELDGAGVPRAEMSCTEDRKEMPCADKPNELAPCQSGGDAELMGSIPLYELPGQDVEGVEEAAKPKK
ncbi:aspartic peptidase domain-containing protein [Phyllosticta citribraziliensis]|uniref:Aspartic peptidase domain-containing protein n=1 Tax=Phyllosticta citribraziliensis TaxID=989973 RepID=A0ABR1LHH2_9PEZI